jgi:hypothetical protein
MHEKVVCQNSFTAGLSLELTHGLSFYQPVWTALLLCYKLSLKIHCSCFLARYLCLVVILFIGWSSQSFFFIINHTMYARLLHLYTAALRYIMFRPQYDSCHDESCTEERKRNKARMIKIKTGNERYPHPLLLPDSSSAQERAIGNNRCRIVRTYRRRYIQVVALTKTNGKY